MILDAGALASMRIHASDYNRLGPSEFLGIAVGDGVTLSGVLTKGTTISVDGVMIGEIGTLLAGTSISSFMPKPQRRDWMSCCMP